MVLAEKNKNPLNLRPLPSGEAWQGQVGVDRNGTTGAFCVFESNVMGVRAAVVNMRSYVKYTGAKTLRDVIYRWAPPPPGGITGTAGSAVGGVDQNHTEAYVSFVCREAMVAPNMSFLEIVSQEPNEEFSNKLARVVCAMNRMEAGKATITVEEAREGVNKALGVPKGYVRQDDGNIVREDMKESQTIKTTTQGQMVNVAATGTAAVTAFSTIQDWRIAAIVGGLILVGGLAAAFFLYRLRKDRNQMNKEGIA